MDNKNLAGKKIRQLRNRKGQNNIYKTLISDSFTNGSFTILYGEGGVKNHIATSLTDDASLCGRQITQISPTPFKTLMPGMCYRCERIYEKAFTAWLGSQAIKRITNSNLDTMLNAVELTIRENPHNWVKAIAGISI